MFNTGDQKLYGVTSAVSGNLLVCLCTDDQNKVVRYRYTSTSTELQEIQYDSQFQPLYKEAKYITENVHGDIVVAYLTRKAIIAVDRLAIIQYSYLGKNIKFKVVWNTREINNF